MIVIVFSRSAIPSHVTVCHNCIDWMSIRAIKYWTLSIPYHTIQLVSVIKFYMPQPHYPGYKYSVRWIEYDCNCIQSNTIKLNVFIRIQRFPLMTKQSIEFLFRLDWMEWKGMEWNGTGCMCLEWGLNENVLRWTIKRNILASQCDKWNGRSIESEAKHLTGETKGYLWLWCLLYIVESFLTELSASQVSEGDDGHYPGRHIIDEPFSCGRAWKLWINRFSRKAKCGQDEWWYTWMAVCSVRLTTPRTTQKDMPIHSCILLKWELWE